MILTPLRHIKGTPDLRYSLIAIGQTRGNQESIKQSIIGDTSQFFNSPFYPFASFIEISDNCVVRRCIGNKVAMGPAIPALQF